MNLEWDWLRVVRTILAGFLPSPFNYLALIEEQYYYYSFLQASMHIPL